MKNEKKWSKEARIWVETAFLVGHGHAQTSQNGLEHGVLLDLLLYRLCIMTFVCDILYYSMFENVFRCNITTKQERHVLKNLKFRMVLEMMLINQGIGPYLLERV